MIGRDTGVSGVRPCSEVYVRCRCWTEWTENQIRASSGNGCKCLIQERYVARPGGTRIPELPVRSQRSKYAKCPIWCRLRTGNAILHSISCTQSCTQNRIISNLHRMSAIRKAEFGHAVTASPAHSSERLSLHHLCSSLLRSSL